MLRILLKWDPVGMTDPAGRRVLAVKPDGPCLAIVGDRWAVDVPERGSAIPLDIGRIWLLPLLERSRDAVEAEAGQHLAGDDPALSEVLRVVIMTALSWETEYWISRGLAWLTADEVPIFTTQLREIALGRHGSQSTRHSAKRLLKQHGLWTTECDESAWRPPA
jgi:hypothetical protein